MSERYNVQASTILGENYKITNIECSDYNPNIDNSITVTITVTDVYGDAISDESVTVTASEGNFTQLNGSNITNASSVTGTTNSSGQFTLTYACSEWGLITFNANNVSTQVHVTGWRLISSVGITNYQIYENGEKRIRIIFNYSTESLTTTWTTLTQSAIGDTTKRPPADVVVVGHYGNYVIKVNTYGNIMARAITETATTTIQGYMEYSY